MSVANDGSKLCGISVFNAKVCESSPDLEFVKRASVSSTAFQQSLIYSGKHSTKLNIGYREFSNNVARPAFNNDVEYDMDESKVIAYKGAQLEVIEATNQHIKYRVISNFNAAER